MRRGDRGKQRGKLPSRCRGGRLERAKLSHQRGALSEKGPPISRLRRETGEIDKWSGGVEGLKDAL